jgi:hypothetical protein
LSRVETKSSHRTIAQNTREDTAYTQRDLKFLFYAAQDDDSFRPSGTNRCPRGQTFSRSAIIL